MGGPFDTRFALLRVIGYISDSPSSHCFSGVSLDTHFVLLGIIGVVPIPRVASVFDRVPRGTRFALLRVIGFVSGSPSSHCFSGVSLDTHFVLLGIIGVIPIPRVASVFDRVSRGIAEFILSGSRRVQPSYGTATKTHCDIPRTLPGTIPIVATKSWSWSSRHGSRRNLIEPKPGLCYSLRTWSEKEETTVYAVAFAQQLGRITRRGAPSDDGRSVHTVWWQHTTTPSRHSPSPAYFSTCKRYRKTGAACDIRELCHEQTRSQ